ncbi:hypothetical protein PanWU01x14_070570 [Parasponia andersonii]|uniref:Uncharacterized protein n=1 Tax=Parasponia andersonii TaxID=3476 RepID=A0A2P5DF27_PARAD|nr:hypothetical protein PanWU01x14_070570 [Parasponia andersonii]
MYDLVLECMEKGEKVEEMAQAFEDLKMIRKEERNSFESEKQQLCKDPAKEKFKNEKLEEKIKEFEKTISEHLDVLKKATAEAACKAVEEFRATEGKELKEKANDIASSTIIYNIFREHPDFNFSTLGKDVVELVQN